METRLANDALFHTRYKVPDMPAYVNYVSVISQLLHKRFSVSNLIRKVRPEIFSQNVIKKVFKFKLMTEQPMCVVLHCCVCILLSHSHLEMRKRRELQ